MVVHKAHDAGGGEVCRDIETGFKGGLNDGIGDFNGAEAEGVVVDVAGGVASIGWFGGRVSKSSAFR